MGDALLSQVGAAYLGASAAGLFWALNQFTATVVVGLLVSWPEKANGKIPQTLGSIRSKTWTALGSAANLVVSYALQLALFLLSIWPWVLISVVLLVLGLFLINFQATGIVAIQNGWNTLFPTVLYPVRFAINVLAVVLEVFVGFVNFVSQYAHDVGLHTLSLLTGCPGALAHLYDNVTYLANAVQFLVTSVVGWILNMRSGTYSELDMRTPFSQLRVVFNDVTVRLHCACPADRGVLTIATTGLMSNSTFSPVDDLVHYGVNSVLAPFQVVILSVVKSASGHAYVPPVTDNAFNQLAWLNNAVEACGNQLVVNVLTFVENVITLSIKGVATTPWKPIPVFSALCRFAAIHIEGWRVGVRVAVNAPVFFSEFTGGATSASQAYVLANTTNVYQAHLNFTNAVFIQNAAAVWPSGLTNPMLAVRNYFDIHSAVWQFVSVATQRILFGRDASVVQSSLFTTLPAVNGVVVNCALDQTLPMTGTFNNFWSAMFDVMRDWDALVTKSQYTWAGSLQLATATVYSPLGTTASLYVIAHASIVSAIAHKVVYMMYSIVALKVPNYVCMSQFDSSTRTAVETGIESLPDFFTFFLNVAQAQALENAHFNCEDYNVHNFILTGSLKVHEFASSMCNVQWTDGSYVKCDDFGDKTKCPTYELAYADMNSNFLCASGDAVVGALKAAVETTWMSRQYAEKAVVQLVGCLIDTRTCGAALVSAPDALVADVALTACRGYEATVKVANLAASFFGFFYTFVYNAGQTYNGEPFNQPQTSQADIVTYYQDRKNPAFKSQCPTFRSESVCFAAGNLVCYWDGFTCIANTGRHLNFQQYPLEAATATMFVAAFSGPFWEAYIAHTQLQRLTTALSSSTGGAMLSNLAVLMDVDVYFIMLDEARVGTLVVRDMVYAIIEVMRAFVFVLNGGPSTQFNSFQTSLLDIVNLLETLVQVVVNEAFVILVDFTKIFQDIMSLVFSNHHSGSTSVAAIGKSILTHLLAILSSIESAMINIIFQLPGMVELCNFVVEVESVLASIIHFVGSTFIGNVDGLDVATLNWAIQTINNDLIHSFNSVLNLVDNNYVDLGFRTKEPSSFVKLSSESTNVDGSQKWLDNLKKIRPFQQPSMSTSSTLTCSGPSTVGTPQIEATPCTQDSTCTNAQCRIESPKQCQAASAYFTNNIVGGVNLNEQWDYACPCNSLTTGNYFCNVGAGFCQEGITPFADPIMTCPVGGTANLVESTDWFNSMCWVIDASVVHSCNKLNTTTALTNCISQLSTTGTPSVSSYQGPYLCRDFCSPSLWNINNKLVQTTGGFGCVCAIGWSFGFQGTTLPLISDNIPIIGRRLLFADGVTSCLQDESECELDDGTAVCDDGFGGSTPCSTCPTRVFWRPETGVACVKGRCKCERRPFVPKGELPVVRWDGPSYCAVIGRAYGNTTRELTALEYGALRRCVGQHQLGVRVLDFLNVTSSPSIGYDWFEAVRFSAQVAASAAGSVVFYGADDAVLWRLYSVLKVNPTIAVPIHQAVGRAVNTTQHSFPKVKKLFVDNGRAVSALTDLAHRFPELETLQRSWDFLLKNFRKLKASKGFNTHIEDFYADVGTFKHDAYAKAGIVSRRLLSTTSFLTTATCPVVGVFIADFQDPANLFVQHMKYNVPRAVCRLKYPQGGATWDAKCGNASWHVALNATPPFPPPPLVQPAPPPVVVSSNFKGGGLIHQYVFGFVHQVTGFNLTGYVLAKAASIFDSLPTPGHNGTASAGMALVNKKLQCSYDSSLQCLNKTRSLLYDVGYVALELTLVVTVLKVLRVGWASTLVMSLGVAFFLPRVLSKTYNLQYGCSISFYPVIPVCLVSDLQDIVYQILPSQLPWPTTLVNATLGATITTADVFDCTTLGFGGGIQEFVYLLDYAAPWWRVTVLGYTPPSTFDQTLVRTPQYEHCAALYAFNALPVALLGGVSLVVAAAALHLGFVASSYLFSVFGDLFRLVVGLYVAVKGRSETP